MMLALIVASVVALALRIPSPLEPVANGIMDRTPVSIAIPLLLRLGPLAQPLALCGAAALALLAGGLLGRVWGAPAPPRAPSPTVRERGRGGAGILRAILATAILAVLAILMTPRGDVVVAVVLVAAYALTLYALNRRATVVGPVEGRRLFLLHNARIVAGFAALIALLYLQPVAHLLRTRAAGRALFPWAPPRPRKLGFDVAGLTPEVTPVGAFYQIDEDIQQPDIALDGWTLSIAGLVRRPTRLSFADLLALPRHDEWVTQRCVSNPVDGQWMSTALFSGATIPTLLAHAGGSLPGASAVLFRSSDGHEEAIPLALALDGLVMLAYAMDGRLLEQAHGFPARGLIPGYYGYKSVKWVTELHVTTNPRQGFWEQRGWVSLPAVRTVARIDVARRDVQGLLVAGVAFTGRRGVRAVQVRIDDGPWRAAALHTPALSPLTWVQWRVTLPPEALPTRGSLTVQARAIDGRGKVQTAVARGQYPSGATGYDSRIVVGRES
jgi:DMSO/TMAO reductase YedYZ molybdopterin-dependent catalytic subunit